jgi:tetratricopeptide (TPR) repeat protein
MSSIAKKDISTSSYISAGDSCMVNYDIIRALHYYKLASQEKIDNSIIRKIANCYVRQGDNISCVRTLSLIPMDSLSNDDMRKLFYSYKSLDKKDSIIYWGNYILNKYPHDCEIITSMADYLNENNQPEQATKILQKYIDYDSTNIFINRQQAYALYLMMDYKAAIQMYKQLIDKGIDNYETNFIIGICYDQIDSTNLAYNHLQKASTIKKNKDFKSLYRLGKTALSLGLIEESIEYLNEAIKIVYPSDDLMFYLYKYLASAHFSIHHYTEAASAFEKCTEFVPSDELSYYNAAQMFGLCGKNEKAKKFLKLYIEKATAKESSDMSLIKKAKQQLLKMN